MEIHKDSYIAGQKRKRFHCPHCGSYLTKSAYYNHKKKFYDSTSKLWQKVGYSNQFVMQDSESSSQLHDSDEESSEITHSGTLA